MTTLTEADRRVGGLHPEGALRECHAAVRMTKLTKSFGGRRGIVDVDLVVAPGEVVGLIGPNGAGKTTTLRLLLDLIHPTRGRATIFGLDVHRESVGVRALTGSVPGELVLPPKMTGDDLLRFVGELRGPPNRVWVDHLRDRLEVPMTRRLEDLSKGNRQKVGLLLAFAFTPPLYLLDEPTSGLDPFVQHRLHDVIRDVARSGAAVVLSSHILGEVQDLADSVAIMRAGRIVQRSSVHDLVAQRVRRVHVTFDRPVSPAEFAGVAGVEDVAVLGASLRCRVAGDMSDFVAALSGLHVVDLVADEPDLEDAFLHLYGAGDES